MFYGFYGFWSTHENLSTKLANYNVTRPDKTGVIYRKYTCSFCSTYLLLCMCYSKSASFIEFSYGMLYNYILVLTLLLQYWVKAENYYILKYQKYSVCWALCVDNQFPQV